MLKKFCYLCFAILVFSSCQTTTTNQRTTKFGGRLVISKSAGPKTFNRLLAFDDQTNTVTNCLMGTLLRINRQTQQPEAELATAWQASPDGKNLTFTLRPAVQFSDGKPFTADDVIFTFQLVNDPKIASSAADSFGFEGQRVAVEKVDAQTVRFTFPQPQAAAERLFDGVPILPKHQLEAAYRAGNFADAWNLATPPEQIVGLGPFKLKSYEAGQRVTLARNEHYWKRTSAEKRCPIWTN
jgi:peptide/nickel transport system substrate-binding protein